MAYSHIYRSAPVSADTLLSQLKNEIQFIYLTTLTLRLLIHLARGPIHVRTWRGNCQYNRNRNDISSTDDMPNFFLGSSQLAINDAIALVLRGWTRITPKMGENRRGSEIQLNSDKAKLYTQTRYSIYRRLSEPYPAPCN